MGILNFFFKDKCPVYPEHLTWIEYSFQWMIENYGLKQFRKQPIIHLTETHFPTMYSTEGFDLNGAIVDLTKILNLENLEIKTQSDNKLKKNSELKTIEIDQKRVYTILIKEDFLPNIETVVTLLSIEMSKIKLSQSEISIDQEDDSELFLYIAMIYFGFGVLISENLRILESNLTYSTPTEIQAHCLAYYYWLRDETDHDYISKFDLNLRTGIKKSLSYYKNPKTPLKKDYLEHMDQSNEQLRDSWNFYNDGHYEIAISLAKESLNTNRTNPFIYNSLAEFLIRKEQYNEAKIYLNKALDLNESFSQSLNNLGYCALMENDFPQAKKLIEQAIKFDRSNAFAYRNYGVYMTAMSNFDEAFKAFKTATKIDHSIELLNYFIGMAHLKNNNKKAAISEFEKSSEKGEPEGTKTLQNLSGYLWEPRN